MKTKRTVCLLALMLGLCAGAMAQKNIDKVVADMEKNADTRITSIKKRDPDTRKVVKVTKTLRLTDVQIAKRALEAFEKDEENALTSIKEKRTRVEYTLTYRSKTEKRTYILTIREGNDVEISVFITPVTGQDEAWLDKDDLQDAMTAQRIDIAQMDEQMRRCKEAVQRLKKQGLKLKGSVYVNGKRLDSAIFQNDPVVAVQ